MANNLLDHTALLKVVQDSTGKAAVDLVTVDEGRDGDQAVGLDILVELLSSGLLEDDGVLGLVLDCKQEAVSSICSGIVFESRKCAKVEGSFQRFRMSSLFREPTKLESRCHGSMEITAGCAGDGGNSVPLPLDHFFFCFLPPVDAAGAILIVGWMVQERRSADGVKCENGRGA